jgi:zinc protease
VTFRAFLISSWFCVACAAQKPEAAPPPSPPVAGPAPVTAAKDPLAVPPPPGITPHAPFPPIAHRELPNGMGLGVMPRTSLPLIELRLVILSGQSSDGEHAGLAALAGEFMKAGGAGKWSSRELVERAEGLGRAVSVSTDRDATTISIGATKGDLDAALEILAALVTKPRFLPVEFDKLKAREIDRVKSSVADPRWLASMALYRELFELPTSVHPYARYDAMPEELGSITIAHAKGWHQKHVTPENAVLFVAGDVETPAVEQAAARWFGAWKGKRPESESFSTPRAASSLELFVVDRPGSTQSQVYVGVLGPERKTPEYAGLRAANQILGGGVAGRLFLDVREVRSLAYNTGSFVDELANGPMPLVLSAGTQTAKTADAVQALLEHVEKMGAAEPTASELEIASRYLSDSFLFRMETAGALAALAANLRVLGLPDDAYDDYRKAVRELSPEAVRRVASRYYRRDSAVVVVAGDAAEVAKPLTRFAAVKVLDPQRGFVVRSMLPKDAK